MDILDNKRALFALLFVVSFLSFFRLGQQPIHQWDEARTGINALEMLQNGDWVNLHFAGQPDNIRAKPPLQIWLVASTFEVFGANPLSLRIPSALATIGIFFFLFKIITLYRSVPFALFACLIVITSRGIIGYHVGRTGDFDALLTFFLLGGCYHFLQFIDFEKKNAAYWAALFFGLAFMTKGPAMGVLFPGLALYALLTQKIGYILRSKAFIPSILIMGALPAFWYLMIYTTGIEWEQPLYSGRNVFERMFLYDIVDRFTMTEFEGEEVHADPLFLFKCLHETFSYWNYIFYTVVLAGLFFLPQQYDIWKANWSQPSQKLLLLSISIWLSLTLFLSTVTATKYWYMAPAIPFIAITIMHGIDWVGQRSRLVLPGLVILVALNFANRYLFSGRQLEAPPAQANIVEENADVIKGTEQIVYLGSLPQQNDLLGIYFCNPNIEFIAKPEDLKSLTLSPDHLLLGQNTSIEAFLSCLPGYILVGSDESFTFLSLPTQYIEASISTKITRR